MLLRAKNIHRSSRTLVNVAVALMLLSLGTVYVRLCGICQIPISQNDDRSRWRNRFVESDADKRA